MDDTNRFGLLKDRLATYLVPLLAIDGGTLFLVTATAAEVHLHLAGTYAGSPAVPMIERVFLAPVVARVFPHAELKVTSGLPMPKDVEALEASKGNINAAE